MTKDELLNILAAHGVTDVEVNYDGGGDQGMIEEISIKPADGPLSAPVKTGVSQHHWNGKEWIYEPNFANTLNDLVEAFVYDKLEASQPGWEIDDGSYGCVQINVAERSVNWDHYNRFTSSDYVEIDV